ncbi:structural maintenance of chromosomes protein 5 isoform X2 [Argentina anserina]|uniref:structural maintenance of chromosomes protein 5 isoform X2 n=1 Tax=Argentina anserina TaxID=57926 RepID=UPI00217621F8|nr:structural maintenance of chromosomes protein 5 isoform X2 [Potentilla anserina]
MAEPRAKRPKISRGEDDYMPGSITEIELYNFMTFDKLKCVPGSRLNLVIGPNGSGKSSLVCAIALGLGGEPQLLGRASSVGAYVKRGETSAHIKITLRGDTREDNIVIMRKVVPKKEVTETIQRFNIQVNNLTQFLPQDRVCEFAKLTPVQLLEETEKAVGDPQLPIQHRKLIESSKIVKRIEQAVEKNGETLNQMKALNAEQEKDVERVRQREELLAKVETMKKKLPWLQYDLKKNEYLEVKEKEKASKKKLDDAARILNELQEPIEKKRNERAIWDSRSKQAGKHINENADKRRQLLGKEDRLVVKVKGKYDEMEDLRREEESRQHEIFRVKENLAAAERELENLPPSVQPVDELKRLRDQIADLGGFVNLKRAQKSEKEKQLSEKNKSLKTCLDKLKEMESANSKLLLALRNNGTPRILEAYNWLKENQHMFNKEVYGPVLLEVNVSDRRHAAYLEGHVAHYVWKSFITQDSRDRDLLVKNLKSFEVPVLNYVGNESQREPLHISEEMSALGIYSRLDHVFDAPIAVKEVLIGQFGLDRSYIGSQQTDQKGDQVSKLGILDFWTPENHYRCSKSRYGGHVSSSVEAVERSRLFLCGVDTAEIERLKSDKIELEESVATLQETVRLLQSEQRQIEDDESKLHKRREEINKNITIEKKKRRELEDCIERLKVKLKKMERANDVDTTMAKLKNDVEKLNNERFHSVLELKGLLVEAVSFRQSFIEQHLVGIEFDAQIREMEVNIKQHEKSALQATLQLEESKKEVVVCRHQLSAAKNHAESIAVITPELQRAFLQMPTTIEDLEAAIEETASQASSILLLNHNILKEYEDRQRKIEAIATKLEEDKAELVRFIAEVDNLKETWLPTLRNLVSQINETFSWNFQEMAVAGEVSLDEHDMDFDQFGILIKVKFRQAGQLQVLSAHHQSGGERSVSTILYLVSLQDLTNCPFRVVDEINQGMDPINERKMFQQLVRAASQPNTPQCFLLTPKLLPDLEYSEACTLLNIMTGPWIEQPAAVWSGGDSWGTVMGLVGESQC